MKSVCAVFLACGILVAQDERELETIVVNRINIAPPRPSPERGQGVGIVVGTLTAEGRSFAGFGRTSLDGDEKPNAQTIFEIGSISKVFTALLSSDMVERGKLNMDDRVGKYLPETVTDLRWETDHTGGSSHTYIRPPTNAFKPRGHEPR
jgi:CubicO group peptidase (beta-lactamase class C family)